MADKKTYYVSLGSGEISRVKSASTWEYKIEATDDEIIRLRELFEENYQSEIQGFWRAHVPFLEYHHDKSNDRYDSNEQKIFTMLYQLGDEEARNHIKDNHLISIFDNEKDSLN